MLSPFIMVLLLTHPSNVAPWRRYDDSSALKISSAEGHAGHPSVDAAIIQGEQGLHEFHFADSWRAMKREPKQSHQSDESCDVEMTLVTIKPSWKSALQYIYIYISPSSHISISSYIISHIWWYIPYILNHHGYRHLKSVFSPAIPWIPWHPPSPFESKAMKSSDACFKLSDLRGDRRIGSASLFGTGVSMEIGMAILWLKKGI